MSKKTKTTIEILQEKSANAISSITTWIDSLKAINENIVAEYESNKKQIDTLNENCSILESLKKSNERIIENCENLIYGKA